MRKLSQGEPVKIAADDYNRWQEAGRAHAMSRLNQSQQIVTPDSQEGIVLVKNTLSRALPRFSVLGLRGSTYNPMYSDQQLTEFKNQIALHGETPSSVTSGRFCVLQNDAQPGEVVAGMVSGVTPCRIKVESLTDEFAEIETTTTVDQTRYLKSGGSGSAQILFRPEYTGEQWGVVRISNRPAASESTEIVEVRHSATTDGLIVAANASGYHPGRIRTPNGTTTYDVGADIWIQFSDGHDGSPDDDGDIVAVQGEYYGPAKLFGTVDIGGDERPLYVCICDERSFIAVNSSSPIAKDATGTVELLHSTTFGASGISKAGVALQHIPANATVKITRRAGVWMIELLENPLVRFELTGTLALSGDAAAVLLDDDGADWTNSATAIQVYDLHTAEGMWAGISGYRGWAIKLEGTHVSGRQRYGIIWMEQIAQTIEFTTTEYMGATNANQLTGSTVTWYDHQGKDPGSTVTVRDPQGQFPDVHSGAKGTSVYDYHNGYYRIVSCQRVALFATASLTADSCGSTMTIDGFTVRPTGDYVGAPPTTPTAPSNTCGHAGLDNDVVLLRRTNNTMPNPSWEVVDITKHSKTVMTDVQVTGLTLQKKEITIYTEVCTSTAPSWATWHTGDDCTP